jgi:hypothetical protein
VYLCGTTPYDGQVIITKSTKPGSVDFGSHDVIIYHDISGAGYANHPTCTTTQPYFTYKVDTTGSADPWCCSAPDRRVSSTDRRHWTGHHWAAGDPPLPGPPGTRTARVSSTPSLMT